MNWSDEGTSSGRADQQQFGLAHIHFHEVRSTPGGNKVNGTLQAAGDVRGRRSNGTHCQIIGITTMGKVWAELRQLIRQVGNIDVKKEWAKDRALGYTTTHNRKAANTAADTAGGPTPYKEIAGPTNKVLGNVLLTQSL